jgi:hypothetical protein
MSISNILKTQQFPVSIHLDKIPECFQNSFKQNKETFSVEDIRRFPNEPASVCIYEVEALAPLAAIAVPRR